jgi:benzoate membrane transport protein
MLHRFSTSAFLAGVIACLVGAGSSMPVVLAAANAVGATPVQIESWAAGICLAIAISCAPLSLYYKMPISTAWSTPGVVLIAASAPGIGMNKAVGAFVVAAILIILTALIKPLGRLIERIPPAIASAMLAGILLQLVVPLTGQINLEPVFVLLLIGLFLVWRLFHPVTAVLAVLVAGVLIVLLKDDRTILSLGFQTTNIVFIQPEFDPAVLIGLGVPLFLVTMASQNLPGMAVLNSYGYYPPASAMFGTTGFGSLITAFFGAHTTNLAAITAAICANPEADPDPAKRWWSGIGLAASYLAMALFVGTFISLLSVLPAALIVTVVALGLLGPLMGALAAAMAHAEQRMPAILTFLVAASGLKLLGVGAAFWGLMAGLAALAIDKAVAHGKKAWRKPSPPSVPTDMMKPDVLAAANLPDHPADRRS